MEPIKYKDATWRERRSIREAYAIEQNGKCYYCEFPLDADPSPYVLSRAINLKLFPENFLTHPIHLHHSHVTGLTIGAVHARCNAVLWQYHGE